MAQVEQAERWRLPFRKRRRPAPQREKDSTEVCSAPASDEQLMRCAGRDDTAALIEQGRIAEAARKIDERMVVLGVAAREWRDRDLDRDGQLLDRYKTVLAQLNRQPQMASSALGQYLKKSLTYPGYTLTR